MGLKGFHIIFIICSILLALFFTFWSYGQYNQNQAVGYLVTALCSLATAFSLTIYGFKVQQKIKV